MVPEYKLVPRGATALLDAVGRAINETEERLAKMENRDRPGFVIFVVTIDGHENSSKEFTKAEIKKMIERKQNESNWHFTFLGADQDVFDEAREMGIYAGGASSYARDRVYEAYRAASSKVARMRAQRRSGAEVVNEFTDEERKKMN
jgi:hypothetical protein